MKGRASTGKTNYIELAAAFFLFVLAAIICATLLVSARGVSDEGDALYASVSEGQKAAEAFRAAEGKLDQTAALLGARREGGSLVLRYDSSWRPAGSGAAARYTLTLTPFADASGLAAARIEVAREDGKIVYAVEILARGK